MSTEQGKGVERTVRLGLMSYVDPDGAYRTANEGQVVEVHPNRVARFDRLNHPQAAEFPPAAASAPVVEPAESTPPPAGTPSDQWTNAQLTAYADRHKINLGDATKKADILAAIEAASHKDS